MRLPKQVLIIPYRTLNEKVEVSCEEAKSILKYDSNKSALWELDEKIKRGLT